MAHDAEMPGYNPRYDMPITKDVAQVLAEHHAYKCQLSGIGIEGGSFHVDHIFPKALGGPDNLENYAISNAAANISKSARRLSPEKEAELLRVAKTNAPHILRKLTELRAEGAGKPINPLVVYAFRLVGAEVGSRIATGSYLRAKDGPAPGVMWWGYFGPDRTNGVYSDILQFGVKVLGSASRHEERIAAIPGIVGRGGSTWYFPVSASLPLTIDREALVAAQATLSSACAI